MEHKECNQYNYCKEKFDMIERRLNSKSEMLDQHQTDIGIIKTNVDNITKSMGALTKALWGVAGTTLATLLSFFVWYIQSLAR